MRSTEGRAQRATERVAAEGRNGYEACTGCSLCLLPCPVWNETRDVALTLKGRARAWAAGASVEDIRPSLEACVVCGACEPVCPENIDTVGVTLQLRRRLPPFALSEARSAESKGLRYVSALSSRVVVLAGPALLADRRACEAIERALDAAIAQDSGNDIALAWESGDPLDEKRVGRFIDALSDAREVLVENGILLRFLRERLNVRVRGLGEALADLEPRLEKDDLLVIESRSFHADWARLVGFYDALRVKTGCATNLDLQRCATPTGAGAVQNGKSPVDPLAQAKWILEGKTVARVVVERMEDAAPFRALSLPVVHLAEVVA